MVDLASACDKGVSPLTFDLAALFLFPSSTHTVLPESLLIEGDRATDSNMANSEKVTVDRSYFEALLRR